MKERASRKQIREQRRKEAEQRGYTIEEELDDMEKFTGSKAYVDCLRLLLGVEISENGCCRPEST